MMLILQITFYPMLQASINCNKRDARPKLWTTVEKHKSSAPAGRLQMRSYLSMFTAFISMAVQRDGRRITQKARNGGQKGEVGVQSRRGLALPSMQIMQLLLGRRLPELGRHQPE